MQILDFRTYRLAGAALLAAGLLLTVPTQTAFAHKGDPHRSHAGYSKHFSQRHSDHRHGDFRWDHWWNWRRHWRDGFVHRFGSRLIHNGRPFRLVGANNYYLMYKSPVMVDDVLETAAANGFNVMRMWGFIDIGNADGSNSVHGKADGEIYFHYWDGTGPAFNEGDDGLRYLDYAVYKAGQLGIKLIIPFTNNWSDFGGMDQYVRWAGGSYHDDFYTDPRIRQWYKDWIEHLLTRVNTYTGVEYRNDPTVMMWELGNEPRCKGSGVYPPSPNCGSETLVNWADEMSTFVKSIDRHHLVSVGDEGFLCLADGDDWTNNCNEGTDSVAFAALPHVDMMSFHLYPDPWDKTPEWGNDWIEQHLREAHRLNKPAYLGEFGLQDKSMRNPVYKEWTDIVARHGAGALYWILSGIQDDETLYPDYDGYTVYCPSPVCTTFGNFADRLQRFRLYFPPVADHDRAVTEFDTPASLNPAANDVAYLWADVAPDSIDLDPATDGQQTSVTVAGGTFELQPDYSVLFTPEAGFAGEAVADYTINDDFYRGSNVASLNVVVKPNPLAGNTLFSFENGTEGWASASWQSGAGTTAQTGDFATDGSFGLQVVTQTGGWFGLNFPATVDLSAKTKLVVEFQTLAAGTSSALAIQVGDAWDWCQSPFGWINPNTTTTVEFDLLTLGCGGTLDLSKVQAMYLWFSGNGTFNIDEVRGD